MAPAFDRARQDLGNIILLEHVNVTIPDQRLATIFYLSGLGLTRDPYLMTGVDNMWVNVGRSQFHLPSRGIQVLRGLVGIVLPDLGALERRLQGVAPLLAETRFAWERRDGFIEATCPWGNRYRCHAPAPEFGDTELAIAYVQLDVPPGSAPGIAGFYRDILGAHAATDGGAGGATAVVSTGATQRLRFCETRRPLPEYDGHHVQIYIADFSGPHRRLAERGLVTEESSEHQYRFRDIVDPASGKRLFTLEHEVRSLTHPLYGRPLVNRNPAQSNRDYVRGHDAFRGTF
ncbi:MAG TPA: glyoxalase/bleomycin resistance/dioxygenase family protein [Burkholderiales bacterium]|nr:glyoxalase/bleomycin resistance/dioxygenase family protein [Burkholderiales bacterium]